MQDIVDRLNALLGRFGERHGLQRALGGTAASAAVGTVVYVLVLAGGMALRQMGLANKIIELAFALVVRAIAVAVALALGLGGREVAGRQLDSWVRSVRGPE